MNLLNKNGAHVNAILSGDVSDSPFACALRVADSVLVVPNSTCSIYSRLWCVFEAKLAIDLGKTIMLPSTVPWWRGLSFMVPVIFVCTGLILVLSSNNAFTHLAGTKLLDVLTLALTLVGLLLLRIRRSSQLRMRAHSHLLAASVGMGLTTLPGTFMLRITPRRVLIASSFPLNLELQYAMICSLIVLGYQHVWRHLQRRLWPLRGGSRRREPYK